MSHAGLDKPLDTIISENRSSRRRAPTGKPTRTPGGRSEPRRNRPSAPVSNQTGPRRGNTGPTRPVRSAGSYESRPRPLAPAPTSTWRAPAPTPAAAPVTPAERPIRAEGTILVSGLDPSVTEDELRQDVFGDAGEIKSVSIAYDRDGKSTGNATIVFKKADDAKKACSDYDGATIDSKVMSVRLVGSLARVVSKRPAPAPAPVQSYSSPLPRRESFNGPSRYDDRDRRPQNTGRSPAPIRSTGRSPARPQNTPNRPAPKPRVQERKPAPKPKAPERPKKKTAAELDAELDAYNAQRAASGESA